MSIDLEMIAKSIGHLVTFYIEIFVGILVSPASTFQTLLESQDGEKYGIIKLDKRPFVFAATSLLIGLLIGSSLSIKDAPSDVTDQIITGTIVPYLFLWFLSYWKDHQMQYLFFLFHYLINKDKNLGP